MTTFRFRFPSIALALAIAFSTVLAHEEEHGHGHGGHPAAEHVVAHSHGQPRPPSNSTQEASYSTWQAHQGLLWAHVGAMIVAWVFVLPLAVVFCISKSRLYFLAKFVFLGVVALGTFFSTLYNSQTPDLYQNNLHHKFGWCLIAVLAMQQVFGAFRLRSGIKKRHGYELARSEADVPLTSVSPGRRSMEQDDRSLRSSSSTLHEHDRYQNDVYYGVKEEEWDGVELNESRASQSALERIQKLTVRKLPTIKNAKASRAVDFLHEAINRMLVPLGFVQICLGMVTATGIFKGNNIFNGLAHFIKGGIFFWYGVITLGRWLGAFSEWGWAWNLKPKSRKPSKRPTASMVESAVIFTYGCSNVFLEHLAAWGKPWSHGDLQHVSIAVLFFGGGLCGMLVESKSVRRLLSGPLSNQNEEQSRLDSGNLAHIAAGNEKDEEGKFEQPIYNPMPALVIFLLGILMGSHHQASTLSTTVHKQWGLFLSGFAVTRLATYLLLYIKPVQSYLPSRPPTEIIGSFCLMAGGIVFMSSNKDTITAMEDRGLDAMFTLTLTAGLTAFLMSWIVIVMIAKSWSARRSMEMKRPRKPTFVLEDEES